MNDTLWLLVFASWPVASGGLLYAFAKYYKAGGRLLIGNALVLVFLGSLLFLGGEIYYHFIYDTTDSFGYTKTSERWRVRYYHNNAQGVRDNVDYYAEIPPGRRRIAFLGDSFTAGYGVKNVEDRFANRLRRARPDWEVQVFSHPGADLGLELEILRQLVRDEYPFDQVVLVYCLNDIADIVPEWEEINTRIYDDSKRQHWLVRHSYFASTLYYRWKTRRDPDMANYYQFVLAAYRGPLWEKQQERLKNLRNYVEQNGGRLLVVTFPFLHAPLDGTYAYRFVHERLAEFWRAADVPHLDLLPVYEPWPPRKLRVNRFDAHPNEFAHQLAAEVIEKFLRQHVPDGSGSVSGFQNR